MAHRYIHTYSYIPIHKFAHIFPLYVDYDGYIQTNNLQLYSRKYFRIAKYLYKTTETTLQFIQKSIIIRSCPSILFDFYKYSPDVRLTIMINTHADTEMHLCHNVWRHFIIEFFEHQNVTFRCENLRKCRWLKGYRG